MPSSYRSASLTSMLNCRLSIPLKKSRFSRSPWPGDAHGVGLGLIDDGVVLRLSQWHRPDNCFQSFL